MEYSFVGRLALRFFLLIFISFFVVFGSFYLIGVAGFEAGADFWKAGASELLSSPAPPFLQEEKSSSSATNQIAFSTGSPTPSLPSPVGILPSSPSPSSSLSPSPLSSPQTSLPKPSVSPSPKISPSSSLSPSPSSRKKSAPSPSPSVATRTGQESPSRSTIARTCDNEWFGKKLLDIAMDNCPPITESTSKITNNEGSSTEKSLASKSQESKTNRRGVKKTALLTKEEQREYKRQARIAGFIYATKKSNLKKEVIISSIMATLGSIFWGFLELGRPRI